MPEVSRGYILFSSFVNPSLEVEPLTLAYTSF